MHFPTNLPIVVDVFCRQPIRCPSPVGEFFVGPRWSSYDHCLELGIYINMIVRWFIHTSVVSYVQNNNIINAKDRNRDCGHFFFFVGGTGGIRRGEIKSKWRGKVVEKNFFPVHFSIFFPYVPRRFVCPFAPTNCLWVYEDYFFNSDISEL